MSALATLPQFDLINAPVIEDDEIIQVDARTAYRSIHAYDATGQLLEVGRVRFRDYDENRSIRSMVLESAMTGNEHPLGAVSSSFNVHSHAQVVAPFLAEGFKVRKVVLNESGSQAITFLANPEITYADAVGVWDHDWLAANNGFNVDGSKIELAVRVRSSLHKGDGVAVETGFFRLWCLNGAVSQVLDLGSYNRTHRSFSIDSAHRFAAELTASPSDLPTAPIELLADVVNYLAQVREDSASLGRMNRLVRGPISNVLSHSGGNRIDALVENLSALRDGKSEFTKLDLVNCQTNVAHVARSAWGVHHHVDSVVKSLVDLVDLAGVAHNVPTFEFASN